MSPRLPQRFGPYTLTELIARGGMAEVYRATMPGVGGFEKTVAIKKILPHLSENDEFISMLIDEARIIVSINHANIAQVYDLGKIDDDYYIAMEFIHGIDLATIVKELKEYHQTVPVEHAVFIGSCICAGLHVAHNKHDETGRPQNIVHRDVSPHNILISFAGDVKIIDFGVAKARGKETNTKMGVIKGKLLYMAPEQAMTKPIDGRADLFAAGLILYRMLTNRLPFEGDNEFQIYNNIMNKDIEPPRSINPSVPEEVNQIVMMLLHRDLSKRYQDGYSAKVDLDRALQSLAPGYSVSRLSRWVEDNFSHLLERRRERRRTGAGFASGPNAFALATPPRSGAAQAGGDVFGADTHERVPANGPAAFAPTAALDAVRGTAGTGNYGVVPGFGTANGGAQTPFQSTSAPADASAQRVHAPGAHPTLGFGASTPELEAPAQKPRVPIAPLVGILLLLIAIAGMLARQVLSEPPPEASPTVAVPAPPPKRDPVPPPAEAPVAEDRVAPEPPPEEPQEVAFALTSTPPGATVFAGDEELGKTPLETRLDRSEEELVLRLELEGHEDSELRITPLVDLEKEVTLVETPAEEEPEVEEPKVEESKPEPKKKRKRRVRRRDREPKKKAEEKEEPSIPLLGLEEPAPEKTEEESDDVLNPFDL